jgi:hypothetical protein
LNRKCGMPARAVNKLSAASPDEAALLQPCDSPLPDS